MHKKGQSGGFSGRFLEALLKIGSALMKNVLRPLTKRVLVPLGLTAPASAKDAAIRKKVFGFGNATLIILNEKMNDFMKILKLLEESGLLIKGVSQTVKKEAKEQKRGFLGMLLGDLVTSLLGDLLNGTIRADEGTVRAGKDF